MGALDKIKGVDTVLGLAIKVGALLAAVGISGALVMSWASASATQFYSDYGPPGLVGAVRNVVGIVVAQAPRI